MLMIILTEKFINFYEVSQPLFLRVTLKLSIDVTPCYKKIKQSTFTRVIINIDNWKRQSSFLTWSNSSIEKKLTRLAHNQ